MNVSRNCQGKGKLQQGGRDGRPSLGHAHMHTQLHTGIDLHIHTQAQLFLMYISSNALRY